MIAVKVGKLNPKSSGEYGRNGQMKILVGVVASCLFIVSCSPRKLDRHYICGNAHIQERLISLKATLEAITYSPSPDTQYPTFYRMDSLAIISKGGELSIGPDADFLLKITNVSFISTDLDFGTPDHLTFRLHSPYKVFGGEPVYGKEYLYDVMYLPERGGVVAFTLLKVRDVTRPFELE